MFTVIGRFLLSPSIWLTAGMLCLGASISLGYHQDQMEAEAALARKLALDETVVGQNSAPNPKEASDYSVEENVLFWVSAMMIAFGLASMFSVMPSFRKTKKKNTARAKASETLPEKSPFQPIADQDEIGDDEDDAAAPKASRIMTVATNVFRPKSRP